MRSTRRLSMVLVCSAGVLSLAACGAGLITGVAVSNNRGGTPPESSVPEISISTFQPLVPAPGTTRTAVVANAQISAGSPLLVRIDAVGVEAVQLNPSVSGQGGSTAITFTLDTSRIVARFPDPTAADVDGLLRVLVGGQDIAPAVPIVLVKQPRATLVVATGATERFLSPFGERVFVRVPGLRSSAAADLQVLATTRDPTAQQAGAVITRAASDVQRESDENGVPVVSAIVPGNAFPSNVELVVRDAIAGESTTVTNAYYRPDIAVALPAQGPTTGGTLVTLIGTALVPYDFSTSPATLDFDAVRIDFAKGTRLTELPRVDLRTEESGTDRLVFTMPAAPDGRPGQVDIVLTVDLGPVDAQVTASQEFLFANPDPYFGPRGAVFERTPVAVAPLALDQAPSVDAAADVAVLTEQGGVAFLQLLLSQQNGMFQPFAAPRKIGNNEMPAERGPRDMCAGDFTGDGVPDLFITNVGAGGAAVHHVVMGQAAPLAPLGDTFRFAAPAGSYRCRAARIDADALPDIVLVPGPEAPTLQLPHVMLARPVPHPTTGRIEPGFSAPMPISVSSFPYEAFEVADLDGDGHLDFAGVSGTLGKLDVAWGLGDGNFVSSATSPFNFTVPLYTFDPQSPAVGLHACGDGPLQSLGLFLSGVSGSGVTRPTATVFRQTGIRAYVAPILAETSLLPLDPDTIGCTLAADLDGKSPSAVEFVVACKDTPVVVALGMLQFGPAGFGLIGSSIEEGAIQNTEAPRNIQSMSFDRAFPASATPTPGLNGAAVFIVHEVEVDGSIERRLSTRLVLTPGLNGVQPNLLAPDAGDKVPFPIDHLVDGNFHDVSIAAAGVARDLALATDTTDVITLIANDGYGGYPRISGKRLGFAGLLPHAMAVLPSPQGLVDRMVVGAADSRLGAWRPQPVSSSSAPPQPAQAETSELRLLAPAPLSTTDLSDASRMQVGDVDGDGVQDLVVLMRFDLPQPGEGDARIALLRGKPTTAENEFPFHEPTVLTAVHGNASSMVLGDFVVAAAGPRVLELAVAVPRGTPSGSANGEHVRFFRYVPGGTPAEDRFEPSAVTGGAQVLLAGNVPTEIQSGDFDRDGSIDLLVACEDDTRLRLFRNTAGVTSTPGEVNVDAFLESFTSTSPPVAGRPTRLQLADVNGDDNLDAIVFFEFGTTQLSTTVATYLSSGAGSFGTATTASSTRIGNRSARLSGALGEWNRDGVPDLVLGWNTTGAGDVNLRILAGGTR